MQQGQKNYLGIEIREPLVNAAMEEIEHKKLPNVMVLHGNINAHVQAIINSLPSSMPISGISIFHPDPWFKARHSKRRVVTDDFVHQLVQMIQPGTPLYIQTDVLELFQVMKETLLNSATTHVNADTVHRHCFRPAPHLEFPIEFQKSPTDREIFVRAERGHIYQSIFEKE